MCCYDGDKKAIHRSACELEREIIASHTLNDEEIRKMIFFSLISFSFSISTENYDAHSVLHIAVFSLFSIIFIIGCM